MNPLTIIDKVKSDYTSYLKAAFPIAKKLPNLAKDIDRKTANSEDLFKGPYLELTMPFEQGGTLKEMVDEGILEPEMLELAPSSLPADRPLYTHQEKSTRAIMSGGNVCVSAGTGAGKTESFLIPIINDIIKAKKNGVASGVKAVLLYPMNALVDDQLKRLRKLLSSEVGKQITFGRYTGMTPHRQSDFVAAMKGRKQEVMENEIGSRERFRDAMPDILLTNFSMLQYLLLRPEDETLFSVTGKDYWKFLVLDEVHTYRGVQGAEVGMLLRRFMQKVDRLEGMQCIATSATLSSDDKGHELVYDFLKAVFHQDFSKPPSQLIEGVNIPPAKFDGYIHNEQSFSIPKTQLSLISEEFLNIELEDLEMKPVEEFSHDVEENIFGGTLPSWYSEIKSQASNALELLYECLRRNRDIFNVVKAISECPHNSLTTINLAAELNLEVEELAKVVRLGMLGRKAADSHPLISARYHFFLRGAQGAKVCLSETCSENNNDLEELAAERVKLDTRERCSCNSDLYSVSLCRGCGQPYINTYYSKSGKSGNLYARMDDAESLKKAYLTFGADVDTDADTFCKGDGSYFISYDNEGNEVPYSVDSSYYFIMKGKERADYIRECAVCGHTGGVNEAVTRLTSDGDAAQSISIQSILRAQENDSKALIFSDSRQGAARFSVLLSNAGRSNLARQIICRELFSEDNDESAIQNYAELHGTNYDTAKKCLELMGKLGKSGFSEKTLPGLKSLLLRSEFSKNCSLFTSQTSDEENRENEAAALIYKSLCIVNSPRLQIHSNGYIKRFIKVPENVLNDIDSLFDCYGVDDKTSIFNLLQLLLSKLIDQGVVNREDGSFKIEGREFLDRSQVMIKLETAPKEKKAISWIPRGKRKNSRTKLITKFLSSFKSEASHEEVCKLLANIFGLLTDSGIFVNGKIPSSTVLFQANKSYYECKVCGNKTSFPLKKSSGELLCSHKQCEGELVEISICKDEFGFYEKINLLEEPRKVVCYEHTAQLGDEVAREYQDNFASEDVGESSPNLLSCSTTFEMGVDLGDLGTVFMRNIPPEVSNYKQRAGRAGRRAGQESMIFTFTQSRSHDAFYYRDPYRMVDGKMSPPLIKFENLDLQKRHINAFFFASYLKFIYSKNGNDKISRMENLNCTDDIDVSLYFSEWCEEFSIDTSLISGFETIVRLFGIEDFSFEHAFNAFIDSYKSVVQAFREEIEFANTELQALLKTQLDGGDLSNKEKSERYRLENNVTRLKKEQLISYFVKKQLLPSFAFPIYVVDLETKNSDVELSRDQSIAVFEYAPGNSVVANGRAIKSIGIKKSLTGSEELKYYRKCNFCGDVQVEEHRSSFKSYECRICKADFAHPDANTRVCTMMIPSGFVTDLTTDSKRASSITVNPLNRRDCFVHFPKKGNEAVHPTGTYDIRSSSSAQIFLVNRGQKKGQHEGFSICEECGTSIEFKPGSKAKSDFSHNKPNGYPCTSRNIKQDIYLGHYFTTDAVRIRFKDIQGLPPETDVGFWRSFSQAILKGTKIALQVEERDLNAVIQPYGTGGGYHQEVIIYDMVPGGAGYCSLFENHAYFEKVLEEALNVVANCDCDPDSSCHKCIRTYSNASYHSLLRRGPIAEALGKIINAINENYTNVSFNNASYYIGKCLNQSDARISMALESIPNESPASFTKKWIDILHIPSSCRLLLDKEFFTKENIVRSPEVFTIVSLLNARISQGTLDVRLINKEQFPEFNFISQTSNSSSAMKLEQPSLSSGNVVNEWSYKSQLVEQALEEFDGHFDIAEKVDSKFLVNLSDTTNIDHRIYRKGDLFSINKELAEFYGNGAKIKKVYMNDRYLVTYQFKAIRDHIELMLQCSVSNAQIMIRTWGDDNNSYNQDRSAGSLETEYDDVTIEIFDRGNEKVDHQRYIVLERNDGTYSRLTMDPGLSVTDTRHRRGQNSADGPCFQNTEVYMISDYDIQTATPVMKKFFDL